jgi:hypothetical protein
MAGTRDRAQPMPYDRDATVFASCMPRARRDIMRELRAWSGTKALMPRSNINA